MMMTLIFTKKNLLGTVKFHYMTNFHTRNFFLFQKCLVPLLLLIHSPQLFSPSTFSCFAGPSSLRGENHLPLSSWISSILLGGERGDKFDLYRLRLKSDLNQSHLGILTDVSLIKSDSCFKTRKIK